TLVRDIDCSILSLHDALPILMEYVPFETGKEFKIAHLKVIAIRVNHIVPTVGLLVSDSQVTVAFSSDTAETEDFWKVASRAPHLDRKSTRLNSSHQIISYAVF